MSSVCRICLADNTSLNSVNNSQLRSFYEKLTNVKFNSDDARPRALCCFCYQKFLRCHTFTQMALTSEKILSHLYDRGLELTQEYIKEANIKQHLSMANMQYIIIDNNATNVCSQVKEEPLSSIDIKEEHTSELDKFPEVESFPEDCTQIQSPFKEDMNDRDNDTEELYSNTHIYQTPPDDSFFTIKEETISIIDIQEEAAIDTDELVEVEKSTQSQLTLEEDNSQGNDVNVGELLLNTQPDDTKMLFSCNNCNEVFNMKSKLISHIRISHPKITGTQLEEDNSQGNDVRVGDLDDTKLLYSCNNCNEVFNMKSKLISHIRNSHPKITGTQYSSMKKHTETTNLIAGTRIDNLNKPFTCHVCDQQFNGKVNLVKHMGTHPGKKPFACNVCDKQFNQKSNLVVHKRTHTGEKPFACHVCGKRYYGKSSLTKHMRIHTGENQFFCHVCDKQFYCKSNLVSHTRTHTGEKPFVCHVCDKQFNQKGNLVSHKRTHTGEKPFVCHVCDKQFNLKSNLVLHKRTHTGEKPFVCHVCDKQFNHKGNLVSHKRTHTGEKPFVCHVCDKQFNLKSNLVLHKRTHTGEKPFVCHVCDKQFNHKGNLNSHMRTHR